MTALADRESTHKAVECTMRMLWACEDKESMRELVPAIVREYADEASDRAAAITELAVVSVMVMREVLIRAVDDERARVRLLDEIEADFNLRLGRAPA